MSGSSHTDLHSFLALDVVGVEFTSVCNLKCVYCDVSAPGYHGRHTSNDILEAAYRIVREGRALWMNFTGIGELTTMPNWLEAVTPFMAVPGMVKSLTTNLQKQMDEAELAALSRFNQISISIDTADPALLRDIRRKSDLRNITVNIARIRASAIKNRLPVPSLRFNVVVSDRSALTLFDLAAFAVACGVQEVLLIDLNDSAFFIDQALVRRVSHLPEEQFDEFVRQVDEARRLLADNGRTLQISGDLQAVLDRRAGRDLSEQTVKPGQTRLCTQLWNYAVVKEDGKISHCCSNLLSTKSLRDHSFAEIMEDDQVRSWRKGLLEGHLPEHCVKCHWAPSAPRRSFWSWWSGCACSGPAPISDTMPLSICRTGQ